MPTGYTYQIEEGISFKDFILKCAAAMFYDCSVLPEQFSVTDYYPDRIKHLEETLRYLKNKSIDEIESDLATHINEKKNYAKEQNNQMCIKEGKYLLMLEKVKAWEPPTESHFGLKAFMISQIKDSIRYDCGYLNEDIKIEQESPEEWRKKEIEYSEEELVRVKQEYQRELEQVKQKNEWIAALRESLKNYE